MGGLHLCTLMALVSIVVIAHGSSHSASLIPDGPLLVNDTFEFRLPAVQSPPKITQAPKNKKVAEDGTVSFICKASGNPAPAFHWERGGKKINDRRQRFEISDGPHITVFRIKQAKAGKDDGTFTCVANNGLGEAKSDASLKIYPKVDGNDDFPSGYPRIETHPKLRAVEKDRSVLLQCDVKGDPKPTITWLKDSFPVDDTDPRIQILETGYLQIRNSQESDEATYECVAENEWGVAYSYRAMIYIKVSLIAPKFITAPEDVKIMPNSDVNLTCVAVGSPVPFVKWRQGALDLTGDDNIPIGRNTLTLSSVKESANYTCEASSDKGNIEHHVQVIVEAPGSPPESVLARAASATTVVVSWDEPKIPNGIIQGYKVFYTHTPGEPIFFWDQLEVKSDTRLATITDLTPNVTYSITVLAYSSVGQGPMSHPIQVLTTQGVPYQPLNLVAEAMSPNIILVKWDAPQEADSIKSYELYFNDSHFRQNGRVSIDPPAQNYRLINLTPDTIYHIQVSAKLLRGEGPRTPTVQVHTPPFIPGEPRKVKVEAINSTSLLVEWEPPQQKEQNGMIRGYQVHYIEVNGNEEPMPGAREQSYDTHDHTKTEAIITGLKADTRYVVQVAAYTRKGDGLRSKQKVLSTKGAVPSPPRNLQVDLVQNDPPTVRVTWQRPVETHGDIKNYKIVWGPRGERYEEKILNADIYSYVTNTLDKGTTYEFRVSAKNQVDYGERGVVGITTPDGVPPPPTNVKVRRTSETTIEVRWDEPDYPVSGYKIFYNMFASPGMYVWQQMETGPYTVADITGLDPYTVYAVRVQAKSVDGRYGDLSDVITTHVHEVPATTPATTTEASTTAQTSTTTSTGAAQTVRQDFECHRNYMFVFIPVDLVPNSQLTLRDPNCRLVNNGTHHKISLDYDECGTSQSFYTDHISVENDVNVHSIFNDTEEITFVEDYKIPLRCSVDRSKLVNGVIQVMPRESVQESVVQSSEFNMKEFTTKDYNQEITEYPVKLPINREIFFEIALTNRSSDSAGIFVEKCQATPSTNPNDTVHVSLINFGCSVIPAVKVLPAPGIDRFRFSFQAFHFSAPSNDNNLVYVHCSASTCGGILCDNACPQSSRRRKRSARGRASATLTSGSHVVS